MLYIKALRLFDQYRREGDYEKAAQVMRYWAQASGERHDLWLADISLLTLALVLNLPDEGWQCVERLRKLDADDPYLLTLISRLHLSQGDRDAAADVAKQAYENAVRENDPSIDVYLADLNRLARNDDDIH